MLNRLVGVLYALAIGWLVLMWWVFGGVSDTQYQGTTLLFGILLFGLPPLVLLILIRFVTAGRL